eukprot:CAMPEP_0169079370 /NCGR_PEP_ID=MMETSP1015-20121227/9911_1 /TAXON_ID=342587 /ORGANISM="Karlodinium micrum, Strain CCMP2283" /LENGTH=36 /DNA_ID= /DNA_START= /DNA_END= /DNA_ORIENTATION=
MSNEVLPRPCKAAALTAMGRLKLRNPTPPCPTRSCP